MLTTGTSALRCKSVTTCAAGKDKKDGFSLFPAFLKRYQERQTSHKEADSSGKKGLAGDFLSSSKSSPRQHGSLSGTVSKNANDDFKHRENPESHIGGDEVSHLLLSSLVQVLPTMQTGASCRQSL